MSRNDNQIIAYYDTLSQNEDQVLRDLGRYGRGLIESMQANYREANEFYSHDVLIYASVSALGFAFIENVLYFDVVGPHVIVGRALSSVLMHMALSTLALYGFMLGHFRRRTISWFSQVSYFCVGLCLSSAVRVDCPEIRCGQRQLQSVAIHHLFSRPHFDHRHFHEQA